MALVTDMQKFVNPDLYWLCNYGIIKEIKSESGSIGAQVDQSSRTNPSTRVTKILPDQSKVVLENGKEYTYRALVLANGLDNKSEFIEGLHELEQKNRSGVFVNKVDTKYRIDKNYYAGWQHFHGDLIVYQPAFPF
jgi:NADH dehydrogenase FAD-containing subunit